VPLPGVRFEEHVRFERGRGVEAVGDRYRLVASPVEQPNRCPDLPRGVVETVRPEVLEESRVDRVLVVVSERALGLDGSPVGIERTVVRDRRARDDRYWIKRAGRRVEGDLRAETRPEAGVRRRIEAPDDRSEVLDSRGERRLDERAIGVAAAPEVEPDRVVARLDGAFASLLVAAGLVAAEAVTEEQPPVAVGRVVDRGDTFPVDSELAFGRHRATFARPTGMF
jgi:hypothetical protein